MLTGRYLDKFSELIHLPAGTHGFTLVYYEKPI